MKKIHTLVLGLALTLSANSQNLVPNPGFETLFTNNPIPVQWSFFGQGSQSLETTDVHGGLNAVKITAPAAPGIATYQSGNMTVVAGNTYNLNYWYKDEGNNAKGKFWVIWLTIGNVEIMADNDPFKGEYLPNTIGWQQVSVSATAPAGAAHMKLQFRVSADSGDSGAILFDDVSMTTGTLGTAQNEIPDLKVYPNPVTDGTLFIDTNTVSDKSVTVFDLTGKEVINTILTTNNLNTSGLKRGLYILKIIEGEKTATRKLIIK